MSGDRAMTVAAESVGRHLLKSTPLILGIAGLTAFAFHHGRLARLETPALDVMLDVIPPLEPKNVVVVEITDRDYRDLFGGRSPLDPAVLGRLVTAVDAGHPRAIGVDIDTSDASFRVLEDLDTVAPVTWALEGSVGASGSLEATSRVLGGGRARAGVALFPLDGDGVIRRHRRVFSGAAGSADSFAWAVVKSVPGSLGSRSDVAWLRFSREGLPRYQAGLVLQVAEHEGWQTSGVLTDKIVLIGGTYREARDRWPTPVGSMDGTMLMAHAVEVEIQGGLARLHEPWTIVLDALAGFAVAVAHHYFRNRAVIVTMLLIVPAAVAASYVLHASFALAFSFVPVVVGVTLHELVAARMRRWRSRHV